MKLHPYAQPDDLYVLPHDTARPPDVLVYTTPPQLQGFPYQELDWRPPKSKYITFPIRTVLVISVFGDENSWIYHVRAGDERVQQDGFTGGWSMQMVKHNFELVRSP